jgi:hypothetical protein
MPKPTPEQLVTGLAQVRAQIEQLETLKADYEARLIALGPGDYTDGERTAKVIIPAPGQPKFALKAADEKKVRVLIDDDSTFKKLFTRKVSYDPRKAFADVAGALLPRGILAKVKALTEKPASAQSPYVKLV